jgi:uncharacterized protein YceK
MTLLRLALLCGCGVLLAGCGTVVGWSSPEYSKIYRGVQVDFTEYRAHAWWGPIPGYEHAEAVGTTKQEWHAVFTPFVPLDFVLSLLADTGTLPFAVVADLLRPSQPQKTEIRNR